MGVRRTTSTYGDIGFSNGVRNSVDLGSLHFPSSILRLPSIVSPSFSSNSSLYGYSAPPSFRHSLVGSHKFDVVGLNDNLRLVSAQNGNNDLYRPAVLSAPTPPRLKSMGTEALSVEKWIDSLADFESIEYTPWNEVWGNAPYPSSWIPEGSLYPPDVFSTAISSVRGRSYNREYSDYSSTDRTDIANKFQNPGGPINTSREENSAQGQARRVGTAIPRAINHYIHSPDPNRDGRKTDKNKRSSTIAERRNHPPPPRLGSPLHYPSHSAAPVDANAFQGPPSPVSLYSAYSHLPQYSYQGRRKSIATYDMIGSLRSQCATLELHSPLELMKNQPSLSLAGHLPNRWAFTPTGDVDFGSRLSLLYPRAGSHQGPLADFSGPHKRLSSGSSRSTNSLTTTYGRSVYRRNTSSSSNSSTGKSSWHGTRYGYSTLRSSHISYKESQPLHRPAVSRRVTSVCTKRAKKVVRFAPLPVYFKATGLSRSTSFDQEVDSTGSSDDQMPAGMASKKQQLTPIIGAHHRSMYSLQPGASFQGERYSPWVPGTGTGSNLTSKPTLRRQAPLLTGITPPASALVLSTDTAEGAPTDQPPTSRLSALKKTFARRSLIRIIKSESHSSLRRASQHSGPPGGEIPPTSDATEGSYKGQTTPREPEQQKSRIPLPLRKVLGLKLTPTKRDS
ncbi:hypothetical protein FA15DRAFT_287773 [Coprinopsis marcescibilis]|uniref:Uncharacterized protein n=1 Tax=Coprinopsis marcescibilis TaxID=230819 RepID=A0A5C3LCN0_COPMA|nr:hypothetical protein FA15DRAFT_287773 [Coprinopsis marcescibilis]